MSLLVEAAGRVYAYLNQFHIAVHHVPDDIILMNYVGQSYRNLGERSSQIVVDIYETL